MLSFVVYPTAIFLTVMVLFLMPHQLLKGCEKETKFKGTFLIACLFGVIGSICMLELVIVRDADGHFYAIVYDTGAVFYDTDHAKYVLEDDPIDEEAWILINEGNTDVTMDPDETFINSDGEIVLEDASSYIPTRNSSVMLTPDGQKRYKLMLARRNLFCRINPTESRGIMIGETLLSPVTYEIGFDLYDLTRIQKIIYDEYSYMTKSIIVGILILALYFRIRKDQKGLYFTAKLSLTCGLTALVYSTIYDKLVKSFFTMTLIVIVPAIVKYLAAPYIDGLARSVTEPQDIIQSLGLLVDEGDLSVAQAMALSTPEGVKSVRRMVIGINVLLTANWLLVIIAVCFNW